MKYIKLSWFSMLWSPKLLNLIHDHLPHWLWLHPCFPKLKEDKNSSEQHKDALEFPLHYFSLVSNYCSTLQGNRLRNSFFLFSSNLKFPKSKETLNKWSKNLNTLQSSRNVVSKICPFHLLPSSFHMIKTYSLFYTLNSSSHLH